MTAAVPPLRPLWARLEADLLRGLAATAAAFLDGQAQGRDEREPVGAEEALPEDADAVAAQAAPSADPLPWLPGAAWVVLAPLRVPAPAGGGAEVLRRLLAGQPAGTDAARAAVGQVLASAGPSQPLPPLPSAPGEVVPALWERALDRAVGDLWAVLGPAYEAAGRAAAAGDPAAARAAVQRVSRELAGIQERIRLLAVRVGGADPPPSAAVLEWASPPPGSLPAPAVSTPPAPPPVVAQPPDRPSTRPPAPPSARPLPPPPRSPSGPGLVRPAREHRILPVLYAALAVGVALAMLAAVLRGWPVSS